MGLTHWGRVCKHWDLTTSSTRVSELLTKTTTKFKQFPPHAQVHFFVGQNEWDYFQGLLTYGVVTLMLTFNTQKSSFFQGNEYYVKNLFLDIRRYHWHWNVNDKMSWATAVGGLKMSPLTRLFSFKLAGETTLSCKTILWFPNPHSSICCRCWNLKRRRNRHQSSNSCRKKVNGDLTVLAHIVPLFIWLSTIRRHGVVQRLLTKTQNISTLDLKLKMNWWQLRSDPYRVRVRINPVFKRK